MGKVFCYYEVDGKIRKNTKCWRRLRNLTDHVRTVHDDAMFFREARLTRDGKAARQSDGLIVFYTKLLADTRITPIIPSPEEGSEAEARLDEEAFDQNATVVVSRVYDDLNGGNGDADDNYEIETNASIVLIGDAEGDAEGAKGRNEIGSDNSVTALSADESFDSEVQIRDVITPESKQEDAVTEFSQAKVEDPLQWVKETSGNSNYSLAEHTIKQQTIGRASQLKWAGLESWRVKIL